MRLSEIKSGKTVEITGFYNAKDICSRLKKMGLTVGTRITVAGVAPFCFSVAVKTESFMLAMSKKTADKITVKYV